MKKTKRIVRLLLPGQGIAPAGTSTHQGTLAPVPQSPDTSHMEIDMGAENAQPVDEGDGPQALPITPDIVAHGTGAPSLTEEVSTGPQLSRMLC